MERLISSPFRTTPLTRPRPPLFLLLAPSNPSHVLHLVRVLHQEEGPRDNLLPGRAFKPVTWLFSKPLRRPPPFPSSFSPSNASPSRSTSGAPKAEPFSRSLSVRASAGSTIRKVLHSAALVLASAVILTVTQPAQAAATASTKLVRSELLSSAWTGFFAGCLHTLSGPDHLAALAPLSIGRTRMESAVVGALWGCGHDAGQVIFGLLFLALKDRLHIEVIRTWGTRVVGMTLLIIGATGIREASEVPAPCVALENGECEVNIYDQLDASRPPGKKKLGFATFATGIVHGLQPDALMMVLPALALPSHLAGAAFLCMFLVGTVCAMGSYTVFIGSLTQALKGRVPRITEKLTWAASLVAISMGLAILISHFFGFSLY